MGIPSTPILGKFKISNKRTFSKIFGENKNKKTSKQTVKFQFNKFNEIFSFISNVSILITRRPHNKVTIETDILTTFKNEQKNKQWNYAEYKYRTVLLKKRKRWRKLLVVFHFSFLLFKNNHNSKKYKIKRVIMLSREKLSPRGNINMAPRKLGIYVAGNEFFNL